MPNPNKTVYCHVIRAEARDGEVRVERGGKTYWKKCTAWEEGACGRMCATRAEDRLAVQTKELHEDGGDYE